MLTKRGEKTGMTVTMGMWSHRATTSTARRSTGGVDRDVTDEDDADKRSSNDRRDDQYVDDGDEDRERQGRNSRQLRAQAEEEGNINAWKKKRELPGLQWLLTVLLVEEKAAAQHRHRQQQGQQQTQQ